MISSHARSRKPTTTTFSRSSPRIGRRAGMPHTPTSSPHSIFSQMATQKMLSPARNVPFVCAHSKRRSSRCSRAPIRRSAAMLTHYSCRATPTGSPIRQSRWMTIRMKRSRRRHLTDCPSSCLILRSCRSPHARPMIQRQASPRRTGFLPASFSPHPKATTVPTMSVSTQSKDSRAIRHGS